MHGQFLSHKGGPYPQRTLVPRFSLCGTLLHHDIRPPVPYAWISEEEIEANGDIVWREKIDERLNWRGSTTGIYANPEKAWAYSHRSRLVSLANAVEGNVSILPVPESESEPVGAAEEVRKVKVNPAWMDIAFVSYADLYDALAFFREHDDLAEHIATQGKEWSRRFWRKEDMAAYLYR
ncbi:hypothetical protein ID866_1909 [Astraeus odoratus]|nr:hypothetical protein ID866_1909 [Astraeus odoratus]